MISFDFAEDEIPDGGQFIVLEDGEYVAVIKDVNEMTAKTGRKMLTVTYSVFADSSDNGGNSGTIVDLSPDYLLMSLLNGEEKTKLWKSKLFFKAVGAFNDDGRVADFDPMVFINAYVRLVIGSKEESYEKDGKPVRFMKNIVKGIKTATEKDMSEYVDNLSF